MAEIEALTVDANTIGFEKGVIWATASFATNIFSYSSSNAL
jgi:hypothetical protein